MEPFLEMATATGGGGTQVSPSPLLRPGIPGERRPLKEKLISYYEQIFEVRSQNYVLIWVCLGAVRTSLRGGRCHY